MFIVLLKFSSNKGQASQFMKGHKECAYFCWSAVFRLIWAVDCDT